jgi:glycoprotein 6-alpha-L-fucosyltransferase/import inner membrane translocase subunit TIM50
MRLYTAAGHDFHAADNLPEEGLAPLTRAVQHYIWEQQHRSHVNCAESKFVAHGSTFGLGAQMHRAAAVLGYTLDVGKIFVWHKSAGWAYADKTCVEGNWLCYFRPPSNCTPDIYAYKNNTVELSEPAVWTGAPKVISKWLVEAAPHMNKNAGRLWWNAQCVAYLMRLNDRTVQALATLRRAEGIVTIAAAKGSEASVTVLKKRESLMPLPVGTISLHVRHGDKAVEMALIPFAKYLEASEKLATMQTLSLSKTVFVSTEDPDVIAALQANGTHGWVGLYSDIPRLNIDGRKQMKLASNMGQLHLLQLLMALECDAWVGTRNSNWAALIDELRCVWVAKCANPFVEVGLQKDWMGLFSIS